MLLMNSNSSRLRNISYENPSRPHVKTDQSGDPIPHHYPYRASAKWQDHVMPGRLSPASVRNARSPGRTRICARRSQVIPGPVPGRGHPRRGTARPRPALLPARGHRRRPGARPLDTQRLPKPVFAAIGQPVPGRTNGPVSPAAVDPRRNRAL